jgi:transposase
VNEATRHQIVQRHQQGASIRIIAKELGISRGAVGRILARIEAQRQGPADPIPQPRRRGSIIDEYEPILKELLARYPNLTGERALQELQARGFAGQYTTVRKRIKRLRPRAAPMALLDRVVDGATIVKLKGKSYRAHRGPDTMEK